LIASIASSSASCTIALPPNYRQADILAFHARDAQSTAEQVQGATIRKGIVWQGHPTLVEIVFKGAQARCTLSVDAPGLVALNAALDDIARRLLGLRMDTASFEDTHGSHPELGPLIAAQSGLRVPMAATPFEALTWAVTGQQINVGVALQLRRRLILLAAQRHSSGLWCYPDAAAVARLSDSSLGEAKFSRAKTQAILAISQGVDKGELPLDAWMTPPVPVEVIRDALLAIKGVGPWTVNYALLRGFGHADGSLHGDVAVRNALQRLWAQADKVTAAQTEAWLTQFAPWRSVVAVHLWASLSSPEG
jgi:DNA-3-methyladenine glycosylase II